MNLLTDRYTRQSSLWPSEGRVILAQYDAQTVVVYQAYSPEIGTFAARQGYFGGAFKLSRMSWIKPNFLWMMYRCGWGAKEDQQVVLAVRINRSAFDEILAQAVPSSYVREIYPTEADWKSAVAASDVRLQWDPDHSPSGAKLTRRAIQLGLRGKVLDSYARDWIVEITDISDFVRAQRTNVTGACEQLLTPRERVYPVTDEVAQRLGIERESTDLDASDG